MELHLINYQSAAPFHKAPQPDRLNLSPTQKMCPRCSTVTESSTIYMPTTSRLTLTHQSPTFLQPACATLQSCILMLVTGVFHVDYSLTKLKQKSSGLVLWTSLVKLQKVSWTWQSAPTSTSQWSRFAISASNWTLNWTLSSRWRHTFARSPAAVSTSCVVCVRLHVSSVTQSQLSWFPCSYFPGWTTVTLCWPACRDVPQNHCSVSWMQQLESFSTYDHVNT